MMQRPVAVPDAQPVGGGNRRGDVLLASCTAWVIPIPPARPAAIAAESVQPVPWVSRVAMRSPMTRIDAVAVASRSVLSAPPGMAAFHQHRVGAEREQAR